MYKLSKVKFISGYLSCCCITLNVTNSYSNNSQDMKYCNMWEIMKMCKKLVMSLTTYWYVLLYKKLRVQSRSHVQLQIKCVSSVNFLSSKEHYGVMLDCKKILNIRIFTMSLLCELLWKVLNFKICMTAIDRKTTFNL